MKTTTKFAIAAVASALMGSTAIAADLGGSCCADLEERIAELEATTVRKGNRKVSVQISGFVGHQVMFWDDGSQSDAYIADGGNIFSRWRLRGSAKVSPEVSAGFLYEFGIHEASLASVNQGNGGDDLGSAVSLRDSTVWMRHARLGMIKIGHGSTATDNLVLIDLGARSAAGTPDLPLYFGGMVLRGNNGEFANTALNWGAALRGHEGWDTSRRNHVLYETPSLHGFTVQAAVAEDNYWDVALRYAGEFNGVRVAFGIGYLENSEFNSSDPVAGGIVAGAGLTGGNNTVVCASVCDVTASDLKGSASILHVPTGLFLTGAAGTREIDGRQDNGLAGSAYAGPDLQFWHISGGVAKNFFGIGNTVLFAEYSESEGGLEQFAFLTANQGYNNNRADAAQRSSSEVSAWGIGVNQYIDAAAMQVFATYKNTSLDATGFGTAAGSNAGNLNSGLGGTSDISTFIMGMRIDF